jgi:hypothetical protein
MYVQEGKLVLPPRIIGRTDEEGNVRELEGGMVIAHIDPASGTVAGPNNEPIGKV